MKVRFRLRVDVSLFESVVLEKCSIYQYILSITVKIDVMISFPERGKYETISIFLIKLGIRN